MRRALFAATGTVLLLTSVGVAYAQTPASTVIDVTKECGLVTLTFTGPDDGISGTHGFRWNAVNGDVATDVGARTGTVLVADGDVKELDIAFEEDEFGGVAAVTVAVFLGPNSHLQKPLDIYPVDTDCADPIGPTTPPVTTPPVIPAPDDEEVPTLPDDVADDEDRPSLPDAAPRPVIVDADLPVTG